MDPRMSFLPIKIKRRNIEIKNQIGSGSYSKVYSGSLRNLVSSFDGDGTVGHFDVEDVAVKVSKKKVVTRQDSLSELMTMSKFNHQNIVRIIGFIDNEVGIPWLVMELMTNGTIFDFINPPHVQLEQKVILRMMMDIASGMDYLHSHHDIVHGDLHSKNCFIDSTGTAKVGDFGFSLRSESFQVYSTNNEISVKKYQAALIKHCSQPINTSNLPNFRWIPPEYLLMTDTLDELSIHKPGDVWAYGTLVFQIWVRGQSPYESLTNIQMARALLSGKDPFDFIKTQVPATIVNLILNCWEYQPIRRNTFNEILTTLIENFSCLTP